ncbi:hypothetical protein ACYULU_08595 [Breznakiellaceae bacterium SP9]
MINNNLQNPALYSASMRLLRERFGALAVEQFIVDVRSSSFDYTEWRKTQPWYNDDDINGFLAKAAANDPFGKSFGLED